jgi:hypothetical protein
VDPFFAYDANYLIDNKVGIILDAEGTRADRIAEIAVTQTIVERVGRRFDLRPRGLPVTPFMVRSGAQVAGGSQDHTARFGVGQVGRPDGSFSRADFVFDRERNIYVCPGGVARKGLENREQELKQLMDKAKQGTGGAAINVIAYQNEYVLGREKIKVRDDRAPQKMQNPRRSANQFRRQIIA